MSIVLGTHSLFVHALDKVTETESFHSFFFAVTNYGQFEYMLCTRLLMSPTGVPVIAFTEISPPPGMEEGKSKVHSSW